MMKTTLQLLVLAALLCVTPKANPPGAVAQAGGTPVDRKPVVVELFTSEGCSSCPPADALLSKLQTDQPIGDAEVIGLEEHVDYWNHDGWLDAYSSAEWTERQQEYDAKLKSNGPYTPQMIVDGQTQFVGSSEHNAMEAIQAAAHQVNVKISVIPEASPKADTQLFEVKVGSVGGALNQEPAEVWMAVTEVGLGTDVKAGENAGKKVLHAAILHSLQKIGAITSKDQPELVLNPHVKIKSNWKKENLRMVFFVQERKSLRILGAASARVAS